jgi:pimeloyl-ACP methyl ester carboxylesterase
MSDVTSHFADLDGLALHYLKAGQGEPVVLLHGVPQSSHEWRYIIPRLAQRYSVIAPDLRGLGDSSRPPRGYDKKTIANDVWQLPAARNLPDLVNRAGSAVARLSSILAGRPLTTSTKPFSAFDSLYPLGRRKLVSEKGGRLGPPRSRPRSQVWA